MFAFIQFELAGFHSKLILLWIWYSIWHIFTLVFLWICILWIVIKMFVFSQALRQGSQGCEAEQNQTPHGS